MKSPWFYTMDPTHVCGQITPLHQEKEVVQGKVLPANR